MEEQPPTSLRSASGGATDDDPHLSAAGGCSDDDESSSQSEHPGTKDEQQPQQQQQQQQLKHEPQEPAAQEHAACQISTWYPAFAKPQQSSSADDSSGRRRRYRRRTKGITFKSVTIEMTDPLQQQAFYNYLLSDGIHIPPNTQPSSLLGFSNNSHDENQMDAWSSSSSSSSSSTSGARDDIVENETESNRHVEDGEESKSDRISLLDSLTRRMEEAIRELGGSVMPKLNWSAPKDAVWMNQGSLCCKSAADVYLLLKSSDFVASDVQLLLRLSSQEQEQQQEESLPPPLIPVPRLQLTLRKWCTLYESQEFRCFVKNHALIGISQRNADLYFEHLCLERDKIRNVIADFFFDHVQFRYPTKTTANTSNDNSGNNTTTNENDVESFSNYVLDVYVDRYERVWIMDFNVWGDRTDSILFDWNELLARESTTTQEAVAVAGTSVVEANGSEKADHIEIRVVETDRHVLPDPLNNYRAPVDTVHLAALTGGSPDKFQAFMDMCERPTGDVSSGSSCSTDEDDIS
jgi:D123